MCVCGCISTLEFHSRALDIWNKVSHVIGPLGSNKLKLSVASLFCMETFKYKLELFENVNLSTIDNCTVC